MDLLSPFQSGPATTQLPSHELEQELNADLWKIPVSYQRSPSLFLEVAAAHWRKEGA